MNVHVCPHCGSTERMVVWGRERLGLGALGEWFPQDVVQYSDVRNGVETGHDGGPCLGFREDENTIYVCRDCKETVS